MIIHVQWFSVTFKYFFHDYIQYIRCTAPHPYVDRWYPLTKHMIDDNAVNEGSICIVELKHLSHPIYMVLYICSYLNYFFSNALRSLRIVQ